MNIDGSNRRDFLKIAGMTVAGVASAQAGGPYAECFSPAESLNSGVAITSFESLSSVFEASRSKYFGVKVEERTEPFGNGQSGRRLKLVPRDPKTYYTADGLSGEEEPHSFQLTFEITNNHILCSATQSGQAETLTALSPPATTVRRRSLHSHRFSVSVKRTIQL